MPRTERYVIGLVEQVLGSADRVRRFSWAVGDPSPTTGLKVQLPFDGVWEERKLIVEVDEEQHSEATPFFDKTHKMTVSGVHRGEQRRLYDKRKRAAAIAQGYKLIAIPWSRKRKPQPGDSDEILRILQENGIVP
jgi:very-short-patch-repair endonuclease